MFDLKPVSKNTFQAKAHAPDSVMPTTAYNGGEYHSQNPPPHKTGIRKPLDNPKTQTSI